MESIFFRIMNMTGLQELTQEIEALPDPEEREARTALIDRIMDTITDYDLHVREYAYRRTLRDLADRGITLEPVTRPKVVAEWDDQISKLVSAEEKQAKEHYSDQFRWHLFSFELLPAAQGDAARTAFNDTEKKDLFLFFDRAYEAYLVKNAHLLTAEDVEDLRENSPLDLSDMYFFDPENRWTYIRTHEDSCGPYYFQGE